MFKYFNVFAAAGGWWQWCMQAAAVSCNYQLSRDNIHNEASNLLQHFQNYEMLDITSPLVNGGPWLGGSSSHATLHFIRNTNILAMLLTSCESRACSDAPCSLLQPPWPSPLAVTSHHQMFPGKPPYQVIYYTLCNSVL